MLKSSSVDGARFRDDQSILKSIDITEREEIA